MRPLSLYEKEAVDKVGNDSLLRMVLVRTSSPIRAQYLYSGKNEQTSTGPLGYTNHRGMGTDTSVGGTGPNRPQNCLAPSVTEKMNFRGSSWRIAQSAVGDCQAYLYPARKFCPHLPLKSCMYHEGTWARWVVWPMSSVVLVSFPW